MKTNIAGVDLIAIVYAWIQRGCSYFISTCVCTEPSPIKYESKFEDDWGNTNIREIDRPEIIHFLYEYLPLIDKHNKQRQSLLQLEQLWLTKDPWFRLVCSILGQMMRGSTIGNPLVLTCFICCRYLERGQDHPKNDCFLVQRLPHASFQPSAHR
jgi:hypothetical protein